MKFMRTIKKQIHLSGIGVHSGKHTNLWIQPSHLGKIIFKRVDKDNFQLPLNPQKIRSQHNSSLVYGNIKVKTIEHLMAVLYMYRITSVMIKLDGEEIPIFDGSALTLLEAVEKAGSKALQTKKKSISIKKPFQIQDNGAVIYGEPFHGFKITYIIEYQHPLIGRQDLSLKINSKTFKKEIAPARTFGFLKDAETLRKNKLALGSSLDNTIVMDDQKILNGPLRFEDEFVRHKILDLIGDLSLLGGKLSGHFSAEKAGHRLHLKTVLFLLDNQGYLNIKS